ncbi:amino acid ABC transporter permease [Devosia ginsengisoli]|uniref:amino acid ABC transporter permease n=1 Tax=Devosia ginsengisoli TaxID=400770 RepID=UPI0026EC5106|nr:ABC transporter permease subunit [Devosia ginsengisoli]MCR6672855.1 ABC transporter permease subunit [Devosia ginsengisoli]
MTTLDTGPAAAPRVSFFNDPVIRGIIYQVVVAGLLIAFIAWIVGNTAANLAAQNKTTGFDFLWKTAGFDISFSLLPWSRASFYWEAFLVGITNTLLVAFIGIVLATMLGFTIGIARLSSNFIVSRLATVYIETIRNIPLLLQLFFWYFAVLKAMPAVRESLALPFDIFINQRGLMLPRPTPDQEFTWVMVTFGLAVIVAIALSVWALRTRTLTGRYPRQIVLAGKAADACITFLIAFVALLVLLAVIFPISNAPMLAAILAVVIAALSVTRFAALARGVLSFVIAFLILDTAIGGMFSSLPGFVTTAVSAAVALVIARVVYSGALERPPSEARFPLALMALIVIGVPALVYWLTDATLAFEVPVLERFNFRGGLQLPPEFVALAFGLTVYTASFIAETVRAGIQAVNKGQTEAAQSLGLKEGDRLRLVIVPQAMRVIVPPLTSQYLNLTKNSSLGAAIGYPELVNVFAGTALNQTGRAIECIALTMLVYLIFSLLTSVIMNWYNARVSLVER